MRKDEASGTQWHPVAPSRTQWVPVGADKEKEKEKEIEKDSHKDKGDFRAGNRSQIAWDAASFALFSTGKPTSSSQNPQVYPHINLSFLKVINILHRFVHNEGRKKHPLPEQGVP